MIPSPYSLLGNYAALVHRMENQTGGAALKKNCAAAATTIKANHKALLAAHQKLQDAINQFESLAADAVSKVNKSLATIRRDTKATVPAALDQHMEHAMSSGAHFLDSLAASQMHADTDSGAHLMATGSPISS